MAKPVIGVLVMAYGTPDRKDDILPYYTDIRHGRAPTPELLAELTARYEAIGGRSNLNEITRAQAKGIGDFLNAGCDDYEYRIYVANKHWHPRIPDVVRQMAADGIRQAVAIVMAPQGSAFSSGAYFTQAEEANATLPEPMTIAKIHSWHLEPGFIQALTEKINEAVAKFPETNRESLDVVFSCHSLPKRVVTPDDSYTAHLREMGQAVAAATGLKRVHFAYQSAGRTPDPWLGPDVREKLKELADSGAKSVLVCSVGFIADHLEVLYDLDIELQQVARELGVHLERMAMLNDHPLLLEALANAVRRTAYATLEAKA